MAPVLELVMLIVWDVQAVTEMPKSGFVMPCVLIMWYGLEVYLPTICSCHPRSKAMSGMSFLLNNGDTVRLMTPYCMSAYARLPNSFYG
jgi:hypothetical protein